MPEEGPEPPTKFLLPVSAEIWRRESSNLSYVPGIEQLESTDAVFYFLEAQLHAHKEETVLWKKKFHDLNQEYNRLNVLLQQTKQSRSRREKNGTT